MMGAQERGPSGKGRVLGLCVQSAGFDEQCHGRFGKSVRGVECVP